MLHVENLQAGYGRSMAVLENISFDMRTGEIVAILGANGAGKTTTLKSVAGLIAPWSGSIIFNGENITGMKAHEVMRRGLSLVPEGRMLFNKLTVQENLVMGAFTRRDKKEVADSIAFAYTLFPRVKERMHQKAGTLSGGEQQMVAIARGLMSHPSLLILDEPSLGLSPKLVKEMFSFIAQINKQGTTVLLVEQNVKESLAIASRAYIIQEGRTTISGAAAELTDNDDVRKAYLGI